MSGLVAILHSAGARAARPVLLAALALTIAAQVFFIVRFGDRQIENEWGILVGNMVEHGAMTYHVVDGQRVPSAFMPPLYVGHIWLVTQALGLGATFSTPESQRLIAIAIEVIQLGLTLLSGWGVARITSLLTGHRTAALAGAVVFLSMPLVLVQASQVSAAALHLMLVIFLLHRLVVFRASNRLRDAAIAGALMSLFLLARGEATLLLPLFALAVALAARGRRVAATLLFLAVAAPAPAAWLARNHAVFGRPAPLTVVSGYALFRGHNPVATADGREPEFAEIGRHFTGLRATRDYELGRDKVYRDLAVAHIREDPGRALARAARKFIQLWIVDLDFTYPEYHVFQRQPLYMLNWWVVVGLGAVGLAAHFRGGGRERILFAGYLLVTTGTHLLMFVLPRYRTHLLPVLAVFAGIGLLAIARAIGRRAAPR
ncbi:MAG: hypothetical protein JNL39_05235 [Opitutaceae bacterium]|nr:hypothetical protein [Opitutaceae bacterium]